MNGSTLAFRSEGKSSYSASSRAWKKVSNPVSISLVKKGAAGSTMAPACANALPAIATAWCTAGCGFGPTPASSMRPSFLPLTLPVSDPVQSIS